MGGDPTEELAVPPGFRAWRGVTGRWWYLWRLRTSPPDVRRYDSREELAAELAERAAQQARWEAEHN